VALEPPPGWTPTDVARPSLGGTELAFDAWEAWRAPEDASARLVSGCVGIDLAAWTPDATPIAIDRLHGVVASTLAALGSPGPLRIEREEHGERVTEHVLSGSGPLEGRVLGRTVLGFTANGSVTRLRGCFDVCANVTPACETALRHATASGYVSPPPPNAPLRALVFGIHHARGVAWSSVALFIAVGVVAVWRRPRPRRN